VETGPPLQPPPKDSNGIGAQEVPRQKENDGKTEKVDVVEQSNVTPNSPLPPATVMVALVGTAIASLMENEGTPLKVMVPTVPVAPALTMPAAAKGIDAVP